MKNRGVLTTPRKIAVWRGAPSMGRLRHPLRKESWRVDVSRIETHVRQNAGSPLDGYKRRRVSAVRYTAAPSRLPTATTMTVTRESTT